MKKFVIDCLISLLIVAGVWATDNHGDYIIASNKNSKMDDCNFCFYHV